MQNLKIHPALTNTDSARADFPYNSAVSTTKSEVVLQPGSRLGAYEIISLLGAGGMGEVYRAKDTRLKREIAVKVLPDTFATDAERLAWMSTDHS